MQCVLVLSVRLRTLSACPHSGCLIFKNWQGLSSLPCVLMNLDCWKLFGFLGAGNWWISEGACVESKFIWNFL